MGLVGGAARTAGRMTPWARAIAIGEIALIVKRHMEHLEPSERAELRTLVTKSKGRRANLTPAERTRVMELARKLEPWAFAKSAAVKATPLRRKK